MPLTRTSPEIRFWPKVLKDPAGCWLWRAHATHDGYGTFWDGERMVLAHRFGYELHHGPIPAGLTIDHVCRTRSCVNPAHLEVVTQGVNVLRGDSPTSINARKTHCIRGHALSGRNLYVSPSGLRRTCRRCQAANASNYRNRKRSAAQMTSAQ